MGCSLDINHSFWLATCIYNNALTTTIERAQGTVGSNVFPVLLKMTGNHRVILLHSYAVY